MVRSLTVWERLAAVVAGLVVLAVIAALTIDDGPSSAAPGDPGGTISVSPDDFERVPAPIDLAELLVAPNDGIVVVHILAGIPSGCHSFDGYEIVMVDAASGRVAVDVWNRLPVSDEPLACTAIYGMHDLIIAPPPELDGRVQIVVINGEITLDLEDGPTSYRR